MPAWRIPCCGVGFRGGDYTDLDNILPLIGQPRPSARCIPLRHRVLLPVRLWSVNYLDALREGATAWSLLLLTSVDENSQDRGTLRQFDFMMFRLFYSDYGTASDDQDAAALSAAPSIVRVTGTPAGDAVDFEMRVVGNPAAGIQEVWVTFTATQGSLYGKWQSFDLSQDTSDTTVWKGNSLCQRTSSLTNCATSSGSQQGRPGGLRHQRGLSILAVRRSTPSPPRWR
jgi:hypothetical protein